MKALKLLLTISFFAIGSEVFACASQTGGKIVIAGSCCLDGASAGAAMGSDDSPFDVFSHLSSSACESDSSTPITADNYASVLGSAVDSHNQASCSGTHDSGRNTTPITQISIDGTDHSFGAESR